MVIDFIDAKARLFDMLNPGKKMVLATSENDRVTARSMSCVILGERIYFQTDSRFLKYQQIKGNKNVALCYANVQIEGRAEIKGHPLDESNREFAELFEKTYKGSFDAYTHIKSEVLIQVDIARAVSWIYEGDKPYREIVDFAAESAEKEYYIKN